MSSEWPLVSIDDIAGDWKGSMAVGPFGSRMKADLYVPSGVRVIRGNNLSGGREPEGDYVFDVKAVFPDGTTAMDSFKFRIQPE